MTVVFILLGLAWFAVAVGIRISALVGKHGAVHDANRQARLADAYRKRLALMLHAH